VESDPLLVVVDDDVVPESDVVDVLGVVVVVVDVPVFVVFAASAVCETPMVSAAVSATPAAAVPPPARAANRTRRIGLLLFVFMTTTIGLSASAPPHVNVKAFLRSAGTE
jgi:hypothetical protein